MQNVVLLTQEEAKQLDQILDVLLSVNGNMDEIMHIGTEDSDYDDLDDAKRLVRDVRHDADKAEETLRAILNGRYDPQKHRLNVELPK